MSQITPKPSGNIVDFFQDIGSKTFYKSSAPFWTNLIISNDSASTMNITVKTVDRNISFVLLGNEVFLDDFDQVTRIEITTTASYRIWGKA
jgi:hypothetical protein